MEGLWQDLRYAARLLKRTPQNTLIAVAILALGIGANTTVFSAVNHVLLRPLPFTDGDRLIRVRDAVAGANGQLRAVNMSSRNVLALRSHAELFDGVVAYGANSMTLVGDDTPERLSVILQSEGADDTLNVRPVVGRGFTLDEQRRGADSGVALISYALWQSHFGGDSAAIGATLRLDARPFTLIGVLPQGYAYPYNGQVWIPTVLDAADRAGSFAVFARMRPGVSLTQVRSAVPLVAAQIRQQYPDTLSTYTLDVLSMRDNLLDRQDGPLRALTRIVGFVLLTACINVATLLLARSVTRRREFAIRAILGATTARHLRQLLAESLVLAALGCGVGLLLAEWLSPLTAHLIPTDISQELGLATLHADWRVAAFAVTVSLASAIIAAIIPAFGSWQTDAHSLLSEGGRTMSAGPTGRRLLGALIVGQTALTLVLLAGAGLVIQNFSRLRGADLGFDTRGLLTMSLAAPAGTYPAGPARAELVWQIVQHVRAAPGVVAAAVTTVNPIGGGSASAAVISEDAAVQTPNAVFNVNHRLVTPGLLDTMGIRVRRGRGFTDADRAATVPVAVVSEHTMRNRSCANDSARVHARARGIRSRARGAWRLRRHGVRRGAAHRRDRDQDGARGARQRHPPARHAARGGAHRHRHRDRDRGGNGAESPVGRSPHRGRASRSTRARVRDSIDFRSGTRRLSGAGASSRTARPSGRAQK